VQVISPQLLAAVKGAEGCQLTAYRDSKGFWTIGYGHLLDQSIDWTGHTITQATADGLLSSDIADRLSEAETLPEWFNLNPYPARRDAVAEAIFNLGYTHWRTEFPKTRAAIQAGSWAIAQANLLNSPEWIADVGLPRVTRIATQLGTGIYATGL
jgi:GH24 family phage-related lysozyme (muramidase)